MRTGLLLALCAMAGQLSYAADATPKSETNYKGVTVAIPEFLSKAVGQWAGNSKLMVHGEAARNSESKLTVATTAMGRFLTLAYTWKCDGQDQEGLLLLGGGKDGTAGSWVDSWHNGDKIMALHGESSADKVTLRGSYAAPPGPDWKWRVEISETAGQLKILMTNITPTGEEEPAVEAIYQRK